jgi:anaerobic ribonucleoside-triphosphate reductase
MNDMPRKVDFQASSALTDEERQPCEGWTRVMGYHRPMSSFNRGKKGEFRERKYFRQEGTHFG